VTVAAISIPGRWCVAAAIATALGVLLPLLLIPAATALVLVIGSRWVRWRVLLVLVLLMVCGSVAGGASAHRNRAEIVGDVPSHRMELTARLSEDPQRGHGRLAVAEPLVVDGLSWSGPRLGIGPLPPELNAHDTVVVAGVLRDGRRRIGNDIVAGTFDVDEIVTTEQSHNPLFVVGNAIRDRVRDAFDDGTAADGLVRGLIMGDTNGIPPRPLEDLRRSGLAHFVAVSGSNVALFLLVWWIIGMPFAIHPRLRAVFGVIGLAVFAVVTRWEPSVIRASVMAAVPLVGGVASVPVDPWMALGTAVTILLLISADLIFSVGFLLSVFATVGVLVGVYATQRRAPRWLWTPLGATIGAQAAVAPIILVVFGSIPLLAPVANLVAAPVVAGTTLAGFIAVIVPLPVIADTASLGSGVVLRIADIAAEGPQLGVFGALGVGVIGLLVSLQSFRPIGIAVAVVVAVSMSSSMPPWPVQPSVVVLDVGQGDAILVKDPSGLAMLIDGGSSPAVLDRALRRHGITRLETVVVTHGDEDHVGGLIGLIGPIGVGSLWVGTFNSRSALTNTLVQEAARAAVPLRTVQAGDRSTLGLIGIDVLGPQRRYLSENDGSVVLLVSGARSILLSGDIEAVGQGDLPAVRPDVLVVPHHGSGTTNIGWLNRTVGDTAVLSYGVNTYGHPHADVLGALLEGEVEIRETFIEGDVVVPLG
jgi:competence protein ComEC